MARKQWQKQEKDLCDTPTSRSVPASGAGYRKGDALTDDFCIQAKATEKRQVSVKLTDIQKAVRDAQKEERIAVMQYEIAHSSNRYALLRWQDFVALAEAAGLKL